MSDMRDATITRATGPAFVERNGTKISLKEGDAIFESDLISTGSETTIDISFRDGTKSRIGPDSEMRLVDFEFGENDEASFVVNLTQGAMRTVTGEIVKLNPEAFEVITPRATAGIRGTEFVTQVNGDIENHLVLFISGGSVMLVEGNDGSSLSFDKPLQGTSIDASGNMKAQSFTMSEMQALINAIAPSIGGNIPLNVTEQGDWADASNLSHAKSSDVVAGREISIVYDDANALETVLTALQDVAGIVINSVVPQAGEELIEYQEVAVLDENAISNSLLEDTLLENTLYDNSDIFASIGGNHSSLGSHNNDHDSNTPTIKPVGGNYGSDTTDLYSNQVAPQGNDGDDRYIYKDVQGTIDAGNGNNFISISKLNNPSAQITTGNGNDTIYINEFTGGDITTNAGNDILYINTLNGDASRDSIKMGAGNDIINITNFNGSGANIDMGSGYDVVISSNGNLLSNVSNAEAAIWGTGADSLTSTSSLASQGITITDNGIILSSDWTINSDNSYTNSNGLNVAGANITQSSSYVYAETISQQSSFV